MTVQLLIKMISLLCHHSYVDRGLVSPVASLSCDMGCVLLYWLLVCLLLANVSTTFSMVNCMLPWLCFNSSRAYNTAMHVLLTQKVAEKYCITYSTRKLSDLRCN